MAEEDAVLSKFEAIVNHFGEAVSQMRSAAEGKFAGMEAKVDNAGGVGKSVWGAVADWLPTAESKATKRWENENSNAIGPRMESGSFLSPQASGEMIGKQRWSMLGGGLQNIGSGLFGAKTGKDGSVALKSGAESGADIMGGIGSLMGALGGPVGQAGMVLAKFAEMGIKAIDFLQKYSEALHQANMQFAEFSGSMAAVKSQQEVRDMLLSQERGERRAGSAQYLAEGKSQLARSTSQGGDFLARLQNFGGGFMTRIGTAINTPFEKLFTLGNKMLDIMEGKKDGDWGDTSEVDKYGSDENGRRRNATPRPVRFRGRPNSG